MYWYKSKRAELTQTLSYILDIIIWYFSESCRNAEGRVKKLAKNSTVYMTQFDIDRYNKSVIQRIKTWTYRNWIRILFNNNMIYLIKCLAGFIHKKEYYWPVRPISCLPNIFLFYPFDPLEKMHNPDQPIQKSISQITTSRRMRERLSERENLAASKLGWFRTKWRPRELRNPW